MRSPFGVVVVVGAVGCAAKARGVRSLRRRRWALRCCRGRCRRRCPAVSRRVGSWGSRQATGFADARLLYAPPARPARGRGSGRRARFGVEGLRRRGGFCMRRRRGGSRAGFGVLTGATGVGFPALTFGALAFVPAAGVVGAGAAWPPAWLVLPPLEPASAITATATPTSRRALTVIQVARLFEEDMVFPSASWVGRLASRDGVFRVRMDLSMPG